MGHFSIHIHSLAGVGSRVGIAASICSNELSFKKYAILESPGDSENVQALIGPKHLSSKCWTNVIRNCIVVLSIMFSTAKENYQVKYKYLKLVSKLQDDKSHRYNSCVQITSICHLGFL